MNKPRLRAAIIGQLRDQIQIRLKASKDTRSAGNDVESKAEGKYDTRSIEENYLADGLARQAQRAISDASEIESMPVPDYSAEDAIDLGALVQIQFAQENEWFFLAVAAGGLEIEYEGKTITVLSLDSPLGARLVGMRVGESLNNPPARVVTVA